MRSEAPQPTLKFYVICVKKVEEKKIQKEE